MISIPRKSLSVLLVGASVVLAGCDNSSSETKQASEWLMYGGGFERTFFNPDETILTRETASELVPLWRFRTGAVVTASPIVANIDLPGGRTSVVFVPSWDGQLYALNADDGSTVWTFSFKPHPGSSYPQAASAAVADIAGTRRVYIASGMTMYCLEAASGRLIWEFDAGTGCEDCDFLTERNEILSSALVFENTVYFGMDINDFGEGKGGFYAVNATTGAMQWYFDLETAATCFVDSDDDIRRFDGYHSEAQLGLPANFFATRRGCDFDRSGTACGNVWSSATLDVQRRRIYTTSSNCDTDDDPTTVKPPPPMPDFDEAIFALDIDSGRPAWRWRPREVDNDDLAFGGVPNLFRIEIGGAMRDVVGVGGKDGFYYVLDRDGTNEITGTVEPYWSTQVVPGGDIGGIIASAAVGEGRVYFSTAIGTDLASPQRPAAWSLDTTTGSVAWSVPEAIASFAPTSAVPGVTFMGSIGGTIFGFDTATGAELVRLGVGGPASSPAVVVDGRLFVGAGTGARGGSPAAIAFQTSLIPNVISAFCVAGSPGCPEGGSCDDGNPCTNDDRDESERCANTPIANDTVCELGVFAGVCTDGVCILDNSICDDLNQCTIDSSTRQGCRFANVDDGIPCVVRDDAGVCANGRCEPVE